MDLVCMEIRLNPCSNGRCSASFDNLSEEILDFIVLILVLMEDALRVTILFTQKRVKRSLNPCSNGRCSARHSSGFGWRMQGLS